MYSTYFDFLVSDGHDTAQETGNSQKYGQKLYLCHSYKCLDSGSNWRDKLQFMQ